MGRSGGLFQGSTFFLQYSDRPKDTFFSDIRLIRNHEGQTTRFPLNFNPKYVVVDIPGQPRFHTYSLPAHLPPPTDLPSKWSLDQILHHFTGPDVGDEVVVVQRPWLADCVRYGRVLGAKDEWGGWRLRTRQRHPSPGSPRGQAEADSHKRPSDDQVASEEWTRNIKRTRVAAQLPLHHSSSDSSRAGDPVDATPALDQTALLVSGSAEAESDTSLLLETPDTSMDDSGFNLPQSSQVSIVFNPPSEPEAGAQLPTAGAQLPEAGAKQPEAEVPSLAGDDDDELGSCVTPAKAPSLPPRAITAEEEGTESPSSPKLDSMRDIVAEMVMDVEQQVEAVLKANHSISSPQPPPLAIPDEPAPVRPEGVFGLFSFGLTSPLSFCVMDGAEPGIARMISLAGGTKATLDRARFIIVPGTTGDPLDPSLQSIANGEGIAPWARVIHEQWIKHCFRDESILDPDDYLATVTEPVVAEPEAESEYTDSDSEGVSDVPPRSALVRIQRIIKAVREWRAGGKSNYRTVYNFVDNLSSTHGIKNAAALYRQYRAYIARVAPDVAKAPK